MNSDTQIRPKGVVFHALGLSAVAAAAIAALLFGGARRNAEAKEAKERDEAIAEGPRVLVAHAEQTGATRTLNLQGDVHAFREATVYAKLSGYLKSIDVDKGDLVKRGQLLAVLESPETEQAEISALATLRLTQKTEARLQNLVGSGVVSKQEMDNATGGLEVARAEQAKVEALRGYEVLRAPFAGRVTARYVDPGALLSAATGATASAQAVLQLAETSTVRIFLYPGQLDAPFVHEGDRVVLSTDADPKEKREAKVTRTAHALDPRTRTLLVEVDMDNADETFQPGLYVHAQMTVTAKPAVVVPSDAILVRTGQMYVVVVKDERAHLTQVDLADDDGKRARILSGVAPGDVVALHPSDQIVDGIHVRATEAPAAPATPATPAPNAAAGSASKPASSGK